MSVDYIKSLSQRLEFSREATTFLVATSTKIHQYSCTNSFYTKAIKAYVESNYEIQAVENILKLLSKTINLPYYSVLQIFFMELAEKLETRYYDANYDEKLFINTISDLKYRMLECKDIHGVYGNAAPWWYGNIFRMELFGIGRFQYKEKSYVGESLLVCGHAIKSGERVIDIHIPSNCGAIDIETRYESYRRAYEFFCKHGKVDRIFVCKSWLLWPSYEASFKFSKNITSFRNDFKLIQPIPTPSFDNAWRIFGREYEKSISYWPRKTALQKSLAEYCENGGLHGLGYGFFVFDGNVILNRPKEIK